MTLIAVMAALICVAGPLSIAIGPIPLSLASFAVYLAGAILGWKKGTLAVAIYLLIGLVGHKWGLGILVLILWVIGPIIYAFVKNIVKNNQFAKKLAK